MNSIRLLTKNIITFLIFCCAAFVTAPLLAQNQDQHQDQPATQESAPSDQNQPPAQNQQPEGEETPSASPAVSQPDQAPSGAEPAQQPTPAEALPPAPQPSPPPQQPAAAEPPAPEPAAPSPQPAAAEPPASESAPVPLPAQAEPSTPAPAPQPAQTEPEEPQGPVKLTVATWGGAYQQAQKIVLFSPFEKQTGNKIEAVHYDGSLESLQNQAGSKGEWDIADLSASVAAKGCDSGLLEPLDPSMLSTPDSLANPSADFLPGTIKPCAIGSVAWSAVILYNTGAFKKKLPSALADLFDTKSFPGKRLLPKGAKYNLELALMADGVSPADVYTTLATPEGQVKALNKLNQIKDSILWWNKPSEPVAQLSAGQAAFAIGFNGRAFQAIVAGRASLGIIWDGQIYDVDFWAIPKGTKHLRAAKDFIRFATAPDQLAAEARWLPYGPVRLSALEKIGKHPEVGIDMAPYIPTRSENFKRALAVDETWWAQNEAKVADKFNAWLEDRPYTEAPTAPPSETPAATEAGNSQNSGQ